MLSISLKMVLYLHLVLMILGGCTDSSTNHVEKTLPKQGEQDSKKEIADGEETSQSIEHAILALHLAHKYALEVKPMSPDQQTWCLSEADSRNVSKIMEMLKTSDDYGLMAHFSEVIADGYVPSDEYREFFWDIHLACVLELSKRIDPQAGRHLNKIRNCLQGNEFFSAKIKDFIEIRGHLLNEKVEGAEKNTQ